MAENKKSFVAYADWKSTFGMLTDEEAGKLVKHLLAYVNDENPKMEDRIILMAFEPMKLQLKRDLDKYEVVKETKSNSGSIGNLKRWNSDLYDSFLKKEISLEKAFEIAKYRKLSHSDNSIAKIAVNDNVTVNDTVTVTVINKERENKRFSPPSLLEVQNYIIEKKYGVNAHSFWNFYESKNWMVGKNKMKDYKKAIAGWESREKENSIQNKNGKQQFANPTKTAYEFSVDRFIETHSGGS